jgi:hypothetical protein
MLDVNPYQSIIYCNANSSPINDISIGNIGSPSVPLLLSGDIVASTATNATQNILYTTNRWKIFDGFTVSKLYANYATGDIFGVNASLSPYPTGSCLSENFYLENVWWISSGGTNLNIFYNATTMRGCYFPVTVASVAVQTAPTFDVIFRDHFTSSNSG